MFGAGLVGGPGAEGEPVAIARVGSFDPEGDNKVEMQDLLPNLTDDVAGTTWRTERYESADFPSQGRNKSGVGFYTVLSDVTDITNVELETPVGGWDVQIYVVSELGAEDTVPADLAGWGEPVADLNDAPEGSVNVPVPSATGKAVLVWFTKATTYEQKFAVQIADLTVRGT